MIDHFGWRSTYLSAGVLCITAMIPLAFTLRRRSPDHAAGGTAAITRRSLASLGLSPNGLQALLIVAGLACCIAMSMPQVHIVAYCADRGFGVAAGAEMLALMLGFGIISRIGSGWLADRVGGAMTLLLGSTLQGVALIAYLLADSVMSLYVVSALFGLFQGGIVPSYAIIVREYLPPREAASRVGLTISSPVLGMALGGWMGGKLFDITGSYQGAFINGIGWNILNAGIAWWLLSRQMRSPVAAA
jgi:predicted MFS family arabinose efflux permease